MSTIVATKELLDSSATSESPRSSSPEVTLSRSSPISYTISPPSTVTSSPILFYQQSLSTISSNDSIDTIKSSTSTIKLGNQQNQQQQQQLQGSKQESSSPQYNKPVSISAPTPVMAKESTLPRIAINVPSDTTLDTTSDSTSDAPKKTRKFNIPNYYVPPKTLTATLPSSSDSTDSTDSTNSLTSSNLATSELPPRLVRKKSGELVKSSLKLPTLLQRSISSPNIINNNNNNNNTNSGFASPRKSVRFASRLINVKMFDGLESPASVSSRNSPCESPPNEYTFAPLHNRRARKMDDVEDLLFDEGEFYSSLPSLSPSSSSRKGYFDWGWNSSSDDEEKETEEQRQVVEYRLLRHNIPQNGYSKLGQGNVWLSSAYLLKQHNTVNNAFLCGFISVVNLAFEKRLSLKMTLDNWKSSCKLTGEKIISFVKSSGNIDEFKFSINLRDLMNMTGDEDEEKFSGTMKLQMCVMYEVNGAVYWANNSGRNYTFDIATTTTPTTTTATSKAGLSSNNNSKNTIKSASKLTSTIGGRSPSPFEEVCSKLIQHQKSNKLGSGHGLDVLDSKLGGLSISNNFVDTKPTFLPASASSSAAVNNNNNNNNNTATTFGHGVTRPVINKSYSSNDIIGSNHRYSNRQRQKDNKYTPSPIGASSISTHGNGSFAGFSYTDLVNNFCFANNATTTSPATKSDTGAGAGASVGANVGVQSSVGAIDIANGKKKQTQGNMGMSCSPVSTASTFQFFSDSSIHI